MDNAWPRRERGHRPTAFIQNGSRAPHHPVGGFQRASDERPVLAQSPTVERDEEKSTVSGRRRAAEEVTAACVADVNEIRLEPRLDLPDGAHDIGHGVETLSFPPGEPRPRDRYTFVGLLQGDPRRRLFRQHVDCVAAVGQRADKSSSHALHTPDAGPKRRGPEKDAHHGLPLLRCATRWYSSSYASTRSENR